MSVTKADITADRPHGYKGRIWSVENLSLWIFKLLLNMVFFFVILYIGIAQWNVESDYLFYFSYVFIDYVIAGVIAFFLSYLILKWMFGQFLHRTVRPMKTLLKGKRRMKKLWIFIFTTLFQTLFFIFSVNMLLTSFLSIPVWLAYFLVWVFLWLVSRGLGRFLYFIFYTW
jgi:hypothetical protein